MRLKYSPLELLGMIRETHVSGSGRGSYKAAPLPYVTFTGFLKGLASP